tara:strand:+ start:787 stop:1062 length:276 start_codon:yes stop_codon:yes gene_type:complete
MNQLIREKLPTPTGWLVSPSRDLCMFFIHDQKLLMSSPGVMTQLWYCTEKGIPTKLKNSRRLDYKNALKTWHELQSDGWQLIERQINDNVA